MAATSLPVPAAQVDCRVWQSLPRPVADALAAPASAPARTQVHCWDLQSLLFEGEDPGEPLRLLEFESPVSAGHRSLGRPVPCCMQFAPRLFVRRGCLRMPIGACRASERRCSSRWGEGWRGSALHLQNAVAWITTQARLVLACAGGGVGVGPIRPVLGHRRWLRLRCLVSPRAVCVWQCLLTRPFACEVGFATARIGESEQLLRIEWQAASAAQRPSLPSPLRLAAGTCRTRPVLSAANRLPAAATRRAAASQPWPSSLRGTSWCAFVGVAVHQVCMCIGRQCPGPSGCPAACLRLP